MKTNITDFSTEIFEQLADCWKVEVSLSSIELVDCCNADDCGEKLKECLITISRPGAKSISWTKSSWEPTADLVAEITPSRALRLLGEEVSTNGFPEFLAEVKAFCWVHDGVEPHLLPSHLTAFSATADAIDFYIDTPTFGVVLHNS